MKNCFVHHLDIRKDYPAAPFEKIRIAPESWRNGLAVRMPNHLGDAVMALPALSMLKALVPPHCGVFVIAPAGQRKFYAALPQLVDAVVELAAPHRMWSREELNDLHQLHAGVGILFNNSLRDALMMRLAGVPELYGSAARMRSILLRHAFRFPERPDGRAKQIHQSNILMAMAEALGAPAWDGNLPEFHLDAPDEQNPVTAALCAHPRLLVLAPGAAYGAAKRWPEESFRTVARHYINFGGIAAIVGSPSECAIADAVAAGLPAGRVWNLCGKTADMGELMILLKSANLVIANDSGIMHLGAALGRRGITVFGPTDPTATGPIGNTWSLLFRDYPCAPCFRRVCPQGRADCIRQITPRMVIAEMRRFDRADGLHLRREPRSQN